jgi:hypothetical protein
MTREQMTQDHEIERETAVDDLLAGMGLGERHPLRWDLLNLYDLGYDHGGTIAASFPD